MPDNRQAKRQHPLALPSRDAPVSASLRYLLSTRVAHRNWWHTQRSWKEGRVTRLRRAKGPPRRWPPRAGSGTSRPRGPLCVPRLGTPPHKAAKSPMTTQHVCAQTNKQTKEQQPPQRLRLAVALHHSRAGLGKEKNPGCSDMLQPTDITTRWSNRDVGLGHDEN